MTEALHDITILRALVEQHQFHALKDRCLAAGTESTSIRILLALAQSHLGETVSLDNLMNDLGASPADLDLEARVDLAAVILMHHGPEEAGRQLVEILAEAPGHDLALARLGWCRMMQGESEPAIKLFAGSVAANPKRINAWTNLARLYAQTGRFDLAQQAIDAGYLQIEEQRDLPDDVTAAQRLRMQTLQLQVWAATGRGAEADHWLKNIDASSAEEQTAHWRCQYSLFLAQYDQHDQAEEILRDALKTYPVNISMLLQLAELSQIQGHFIQALTLLKRAINEDDKNPALWARFSGICLQCFDQRARKAAEKAVELSECLEVALNKPAGEIKVLALNAKTALAQVESQEQNYGIAKQLFREVLDENPAFLPALRGLGQQEMQCGNIDAAVKLFEQVTLLDPVSGYSALINARRFPEDVATLDSLEEMARVPSLEGPVRAGILFQLAAAWEKRQEYDKAFSFAEEANGIDRKFVKYDAKEHRNRCARIRYAFCKELYVQRRACGVDSALPLYVLGMPRSGTTLVEQILAGHSEIFGAGELGAIPAVIQGLERWERYTGSGRHYPDCIDDLTPEVVKGIAGNLLKELQEHDPAAKYIIDKLPHNFENIGLIKFFYPKAKIISVRRDPRDIAISNYFTDYQAKHGGMGFAYDLTHIGEQLADHNLLMHHWHQLFPGEILEVNYEDIVEDPEGMSRTMLNYLGVSWESQVLRFNELDRPVKTASVWQVRQPIYKTSRAKWENYRQYLAPLTKGTNARIEPDPIEMITLPEPGFLTNGFELYKKGDYDGAELSFKKMLHYNPQHAACNYMVGEIYLRKNHLADGIALIEKALGQAPWKREWTANLLKAYELTSQDEKIEALKKRYRLGDAQEAKSDQLFEWDAPEDSKCAS